MLIALLDNILVVLSVFYFTLFLMDYSFIFHERAISNIIYPTAILGLFVFALWLIDKEKFYKSNFFRIASKLKDIRARNFIFFSVSAVSIVFSVVSIARHFSLSSGTSDLGIFDQAVWNASQTGVLFSSLKHNINLLGDHFEPILLFIAPLYRIWPSATLLLILQAILLASAIIPLYLIARKIVGENPVIYAIIVSYMLSRPLRGVAYSDFHPECFILPILFWAYYFLIERKDGLFLFSLFLLVLCKEDVAFLIIAFGIFIGFFQKRARLGIFISLSGLAIWFLETKFIIPYFNPRAGFAYMNRFPLGATYADNIRVIAANPLSLVKVLFVMPKAVYIFKLFAPLLFLSLLSPAHYVLFAVPLLKNLFVNPDFGGFYNITSHYTAGVVPFIYISAIYGSSLVIARLKEKRAVSVTALLIILCSLIGYSKTDGHQFGSFLDKIRNNRTLERLSYLRAIPRDASVSANFSLVPHMSERKYIYEFNPFSLTSNITEYVVIDMKSLEYLTKEDIAAIGPYINNITNKGYKKVFESRDRTFLIFRNPGIDKTLVEKLI